MLIERYFPTDINLNYDFSSFIFLKFRNNQFQGAPLAGSKGVNFIQSEYQKQQNDVICCHPGVFTVNIKLNQHLFLVVFCY